MAFRNKGSKRNGWLKNGIKESKKANRHAINRKVRRMTKRSCHEETDGYEAPSSYRKLTPYEMYTHVT